MNSKRHKAGSNSEQRSKIRKRMELSAEGFLTDEDVKRIRKKLGFTQKEIAEKLGVGLKNFAHYENQIRVTDYNY